MFNLENSQILFVVNSFVFQLFLIVHFTLRKWRFDLAMGYGRIIYALSIPSAIVSIIRLRGGEGWEASSTSSGQYMGTPPSIFLGSNGVTPYDGLSLSHT